MAADEDNQYVETLRETKKIYESFLNEIFSNSEILEVRYLSDRMPEVFDSLLKFLKRLFVLARLTSYEKKKYIKLLEKFEREGSLTTEEEMFFIEIKRKTVEFYLKKINEIDKRLVDVIKAFSPSGLAEAKEQFERVRDELEREMESLIRLKRSTLEEMNVGAESVKKRLKDVV